MDSGVCTGALGRGRSSSRKLNGLLRSTLPFVGPTELVVGPVWTRSEDNAADDPARGRAVRDAGPADPDVLAYIQEAGGRFEQAIDASRRLLLSRAAHLPRRLLEVLSARAEKLERFVEETLPDRSAHVVNQSLDVTLVVALEPAEPAIKTRPSRARPSGVAGRRHLDAVAPGLPRAVAVCRPPLKLAPMLATLGEFDASCMLGRMPGDRRPTFLEVFAGCATLSAAAAKAGFRVLPPIDILYGARGNVLDATVAAGIMLMIQSGSLRWLHLGTPCTTFCRIFVMFHHLCSRTTECPEGDGTFDREVEGNRFVSLSCRFIEAAMQNGVWWTLENPRASLMWAVPRLATILKKPSVQ